MSVIAVSAALVGLGGQSTGMASNISSMEAANFVEFSISTHITIKLMLFVKVAEKVFMALELPSAGNVDLVKWSKLQRTAEDPPEFGSMFFRY